MEDDDVPRHVRCIWKVKQAHETAATRVHGGCGLLGPVRGRRTSGEGVLGDI
jgi:hypothetical protein